jgi:hypothetical protein
MREFALLSIAARPKPEPVLAVGGRGRWYTLMAARGGGAVEEVAAVDDAICKYEHKQRETY